jgi:hypothetical protein
VALHETRIPDTIVGGGRSHTAIAFLHNDRKNKSSINTRRAGDRLDAVVHIVDLVISVIRDAPLGAGVLYNRPIVVEPFND